MEERCTLCGLLPRLTCVGGRWCRCNVLTCFACGATPRAIGGPLLPVCERASLNHFACPACTAQWLAAAAPRARALLEAEYAEAVWRVRERQREGPAGATRMACPACEREHARRPGAHMDSRGRVTLERRLERVEPALLDYAPLPAAADGGAALRAVVDRSVTDDRWLYHVCRTPACGAVTKLDAKEWRAALLEATDPAAAHTMTPPTIRCAACEARTCIACDGPGHTGRCAALFRGRLVCCLPWCGAAWTADAGALCQACPRCRQGWSTLMPAILSDVGAVSQALAVALARTRR